MAEPARRTPAGHDAPGWADTRRLIAVALQAVPSAFAAYLASGCDDTTPAEAMLGLVLGVIQHLEETVRHIDLGEEVIAEACARAVEQDRAAWPRSRGYPLRAVT